jgi:5-methylcytosine-specific restriction endonuclease McrA
VRTLVLNASYEPLGVVSLRRAVVLLLAEKADAVESSDAEIRSAVMSVPAPAVIKLRQMVRVPYKRTAPMSRRLVLARDGHSCQYCGRHADTIDHIQPRSRGGKNVWENCVAACRPCNAKKADRTPAEAGMVLRTTPRPPFGVDAFILAFGTVDETWAPYLGLATA